VCHRRFLAENLLFTSFYEEGIVTGILVQSHSLNRDGISSLKPENIYGRTEIVAFFMKNNV
jgi:hypothetical protein